MTEDADRVHDHGVLGGTMSVDDGRENPLAFIVRVGEVLAGTLDYDETHNRLLDLVVPALVDMCSIHLLDDERRFRRIAARHHTPETAAISQRIGDTYLDEGESVGPIHQLLASGRSLLSTPGTDDLLDQIVGPHRRTTVLGRVELTSIMIVPLIAHGRPLGVLALSTVAPRAPASQSDLHLAEDVAHRAALAIDRARLYREACRSRQDAERAQRRLTFLAEASSALAASLDAQTTIQTAVKLAVPLLADCCGVTMIGNDGSIRRVAAAHVDPELQALMEQDGSDVPISGHPSHPIRRALDTGQPVLVTDITEADLATYADAAHLKLLQRLAFRTVLVVPLEARGRQLGALSLAMADPTRSFDDEDIALGVELAGRTAVALDNARLYQAAREATATARKATDDLEQNLGLSDAIVRHIAEGILVVDRAGCMTFANPVAEQLLGWSGKELLGRHGHEMMHVRDAAGTPFPAAECALQSVFAGGGTVRLDEAYFLRADGTTFPVSVISSPLVRGGQVVGGVTVFRDISDERRNREALRESEERLQRALRAGGMVMWERDFVTGRTVRSEHAPLLYGRPSEELLEDSLNHLRLVHPDDREHVTEVVHQAIDAGTGCQVEYRVLWPDGTVRWLSGRASVFKDEHGRTRGISGTTHDITDRKAAELERNQLLVEREAEAEELRGLHRRLQQSLEALLGIHEVGKLLTSVSDLDAMAQRLLKIAMRAARLRAAVLRRYTGGEILEPWQGVGDEAAIQAATSLAQSSEPQGHAVTLRQTWSTRIAPATDGTAALMVWRLPLIVKGEPIGVLEGIGEPRPADEPTLEILGSIALQAATAVENVRLYQEVADRERALQRLVQALMQAQEDERRRLAYEIHDGFAQLVSGLQQLLEAYAHELPRDPADARHRIGVAVALARRTVQEIRRVLAGLRPTVLDDFGLARGLRAFVDGLAAEGFTVEYAESLGPVRLSSTIEMTLFRLAQEALANVRKHAGVQRATLRLERTNGQVVLEVQDKGQGFAESKGHRTEHPGAQLGLLSMQERIAQVGGSLEISSRLTEGTLVRAVVPIASAPGTPDVIAVGGTI